MTSTGTPRRSRIGRRGRWLRRTIVITSAVAALAVIAVTGTGAYFTSSTALPGQQATVATLAPVTTLTATATGSTVGRETRADWSSAKALPWATGSPAAAVTYTVQRNTVDDFSAAAEPTTVYQGSALSATDTMGLPASVGWQAQSVDGMMRQNASFSMIGGRLHGFGIFGPGEGSASALWTYSTPTEISGWAAQVQSFDTGRDHVCALLVTGALQCYGFNTKGQVGNGSTATASAPAAVADTRGVFAGKTIAGVEAGMSFSCAWTTDGVVGCWGDNEYGQLGNPAFADTFYANPVPVAGMVENRGTAEAPAPFALDRTPLVDLATGEFHTCAIRGPATIGGSAPDANATVVCWGRNNWKQLGSQVPQTVGNRNFTPTAVKDTNGLFVGLTRISSGEAVSCVVTSATDTANVACWGGGGLGVLGDGANLEVDVPRRIVSTGRGFIDVSINTQHGCAVTATAYTCWGIGGEGQLGGGTATSGIQAPIPMTELAAYAGAGSITSIGTGWGHSCATTSRGSLVCWGANGARQLGTNTTTNTSTPTPSLYNVNPGGSAVLSPLLPRLVDVSQRWGFVSAFANGAVYRWGTSQSGPFGTAATSAVVVNGFATNTTLVATGGDFLCAAANPGGISCAGFNHVGQLGNNSTTESASAVRVVDTNNVFTGKTIIDLDAGQNHACALASDGTIGCWGQNWDSAGALGGGVPAGVSTSAVPVRVTDPNGVLTGGSNRPTSLAVGLSWACAGTRTGVACWGGQSQGSLGNGRATTGGPAAVAVTDPAGAFAQGVTDLSTGESNACAIARSNGRTYCWGQNTGGAIGTGSTSTLVDVPTLVDTTERFDGVMTNRWASCGWNAAGTSCWGNNTNGTLGRAPASNTVSLPRPVADTSAQLRGGVASGSLGSTNDGTACVVTARNALVCWGSSSSYQGGRNSTTNQTAPLQISGTVAPLGGNPSCLDGAALLADNVTCSLVPARTYFYRIGYTVSGADNWVSETKTARR